MKKSNIFNGAGVVRPTMDGVSRNRSPYEINILELIRIFAYSSERIEILRGLVQYRKDLANIGIISGFQWLNGSFVTDIENIENRPPNDIDVVNFIELPQHETQKTFLAKSQNLLDTKYTKPKYKVDSYPVVLNQRLTPYLIRDVSYWYSMWSHRKSDNMWKGFFMVPFSPEEDLEAEKLLICDSARLEQ